MTIPEKKFRIFLRFVLAIALVAYISFILAFSNQSVYFDFYRFYSSARFFLDGQNLYTPMYQLEKPGLPEGIPRAQQAEILHPNLNPPFYTLLFIPISLLRIEQAYIVFSLLSVLCGLAAVRIISSELHRSGQGINPDGLQILLLIYFPTFVTIVYGQVSLILLLLLAIGWKLSRQGDERLAGIIFGVTLSLKIFSGIFLIFFAFRRKWRLLAWYVGTFIICNLVAVSIFGLDAHIQYLRILQGVTWYAAGWNASFFGFFMRILGGSENIPLIDAPELAYFAACLFSLASLVTLAWIAWLRKDEPKWSFDLGFALAVVVMLLVSPLGWMYYFPVLVIPFTVVFAVSRLNSQRLLPFIVTAWAFTTFPHKLVPAPDIEVVDMFFFSGVYFYGLVILLSLLIVTYIQKNVIIISQS